MLNILAKLKSLYCSYLFVWIEFPKNGLHSSILNYVKKKDKPISDLHH